MFASAPLLVLKRKLLNRVVVCLFLLPMTLVFAWGIYRSLEPPPDTASAKFDAVLGLLCAVTLVAVMVHESGRLIRLYPEGIEQIKRGRTVELRWEDVTEVWFQAMKVQVGGVIGYAIGKALDRRRKGLPLDESSTNMAIRVLGRGGEKILVTSSDKDVLKGFETIVAHVAPRLFEEAKRRVQQGDTVTFDRISVSLRGIGLGRKDPVAFHEIETLEISAGKLRLKKKGAWLDTISVPVRKIPNLFVLTELYAQLAPGPVDRTALQMGQNLAGRMIAAG
ncbi:MAG TPA: DUF6585 family protein [Thermoanaerobaculia bacterium]|jgi:hypothetical protein|nr:DUF6585 family protein [Thermoanaerobaculia bacterium]